MAQTDPLLAQLQQSERSARERRGRLLGFPPDVIAAGEELHQEALQALKDYKAAHQEEGTGPSTETPRKTKA